MLFVAFLVIYVGVKVFEPGHGEGSGAVRVTVPDGADAGDIGALLEQRGVVANGGFFSLRATITGRRGGLKSGDYVLAKGMSYDAALEAISAGPRPGKVVETFSFTIPEGRSRREIVSLVKKSSLEGDYLKASSASPRSRARARSDCRKPPRRLEGFLFPATYDLRRGRAPPATSSTKQLDAFADNLAEVDLTAARKRKNLTRYDVLIIASMVEREAQLDKERPLIAAVIYNRLREGMPLGIDATIRYYENNWTRPLLRLRARRDSPYNTRMNRRPAADADRQPGPREPAGRGQARERRLPLLRRQAGHVRRARVLEHRRAVRARQRPLQRRARQAAGGQLADHVLTRGSASAAGPIAHSRSPAMHNAALRGSSAWTTGATQRLADPARRCSRRRCARCRRRAFAASTSRSRTRRRRSALADTRDGDRARGRCRQHAHLRTTGRIEADNTDVGGLLDAHRPVRHDPRGATALVLGAGGAGARRRVRPAERRRRRRRWSGTGPRSARERCAAELGGRAVDARRTGRDHRPVHVRRAHDGARIRSRRFPSTPIRSEPEAAWSTWSIGPEDTAFLAAARSRGADVVDGLEILVAQGAACTRTLDRPARTRATSCGGP